MTFEFATAHRVLFGVGTVSQVGPITSVLGSSVLVVCGNQLDRAAVVVEPLRERMPVATWQVPTEPTVDNVRCGVALAHEVRADAVVAIGGGSALDTGKAIAALIRNDGDILDYLEVVGAGHPLLNPSAPFVAVPTTSGTGSEVTRNAVVSSPAHRQKASLRSAHMLARAAIIDPELTMSLPWEVSASTGLDAITQLIEAYVSKRANPMTDALCRQGLLHAGRSIRTVCEEPSNIDARRDMSLASVLGGMALANAGLGAVHGLAAIIGGMFDAPHGAVCACLLSGVIELNNRLAGDGSETRARLDEVATLLVGRGAATPQLVSWVDHLCLDLRIPTMAAWGIERSHVTDLACRAVGASSTKSNPAPVAPTDLEAVLLRSLGAA